MKTQINAFDINGNLYKQGLYSKPNRVWAAKSRMNAEYGGGLRFETILVPLETKKPLPVYKSLGKSHCFCPNTPLYAQKCDTCGKTPYTD